MRQLMLNLWRDDGGALLAVEWVILATVLVIGVVVGLVAVRAAVITELEELANGVLSLNQSFSFAGQSTCFAIGGGSGFVDFNDSINSSIAIRNVGVIPNTADANPCD